MVYKPSYTSSGSSCAACAICAICFADGPVPDFEGLGIAGLFGLFS